MKSYKKRFAALAICSALTLTLGGCFKKKDAASDAATITASCVAEEVDMCIDFGKGYTAATAELVCDGLESTFEDSDSCTTTDLAGSCKISEEGLTSTYNYYSPTFNESTSEAACDESEGTFTAAE